MDLSKRYKDINGKKCDILEMMVASPEWAANRIQAGEDAIAELAELVVAYNKLCDITRHQGADICAMKEALRPFANYACNPPCGCHNCRAKELLEGP